MSAPVGIGDGPARVAQEIAGLRRQLDYLERQMDADLGRSLWPETIAESLSTLRIQLAHRLLEERIAESYSKSDESNQHPEPQHPQATDARTLDALARALHFPSHAAAVAWFEQELGVEVRTGPPPTSG